MLTPQAALKSVFRNYFIVAGRAPRSEFWWFALFQAVLFAVVLVVRLRTVGSSTSEGMPVTMSMMLSPVIVLAVGLTVPNITLYVRRLHDAGFSGWFYFLTCIPTVGVVVVLVFALLPSQPAGARFDAVGTTGSATPAWDPSKTLS